MTHSTLRLPRAAALLEDAIARGATPGAQLSVRAPGHHIDLCVGRLGYTEGSAAVTTDTPYDLASLTKPLTALAWMHSTIGLDTKVAELLPWMRGAPAQGTQIESLLTHRAQLAPWRPFYAEVLVVEAGSAKAREMVLGGVAQTPLAPSLGSNYSDLGYILAGEALSEALSEPLGELIDRLALEALGLRGKLGFRGVGAGWRDPEIAPTEDCPWRGRLLQGEVHDDNAFALGGCAGHAGIFGTASALVALGGAMLSALKGKDRGISPAVARSMLAPRAHGSHRLGWDTRCQEGSSAGSLMGESTFGHLGFTGVSLWCDPDAELSVALVTNRVHPRRDNLLIRGLRPALHDGVVEDLRGA